MDDRLLSDNPTSELKNTIHRYAGRYGSPYIKCVIIREKGELYLYLAEVHIQYEQDTPVTRVPLIENFASYAVVQKFVDVKPDWARPEVFGHRMHQILQRLMVFGSDGSSSKLE